jgi:tetratricopeptide (TPR) repeat protein
VSAARARPQSLALSSLAKFVTPGEQTVKRFLFSFALFLAGTVWAHADEFQDNLERLDKAEQYSELITYFEENNGPTRELSARESYLAMDGYFGLNNYEKTVLYGTVAIAKDPKNEMAARVCMYAEESLNRDHDAVETGLKWIAVCPDGGKIYKDLAIAFGNVKDFANALKYSQIACERVPDDEKCIGVYIYALSQVQGVDSAMKFYNDLTEKRAPVDSFVTIQLEKGLYDQNAFDKAIPMMEQSLRDDPSNAEVSRLYIDVLRRTGKLDHAYAAGSEWIEKYKPDGPWCNVFGTILFEKKQYPKAEDYFEKAVLWDEWNQTAVENVIVVLNEQDKYGAAIEYAAKWRDGHSSEWTAKMDHEIGSSYCWLKVYDLAEMYYRRAQTGDPKESDYVRDVVFALRKEGRPAEAIEFGRHWLANEGKGNTDVDDLNLSLKNGEQELSAMSAPARKTNP